MAAHLKLVHTGTVAASELGGCCLDDPEPMPPFDFGIKRKLIEVFRQFRKVEALVLHARQRCPFAKRASDKAVFLDIFHRLARLQRAQPIIGPIVAALVRAVRIANCKRREIKESE